MKLPGESQGVIVITRESWRALKVEPFQDPRPCTASSTGFPPPSFLSIFCELLSSPVSVLNFSKPKQQQQQRKLIREHVAVTSVPLSRLFTLHLPALPSHPPWAPAVLQPWLPTPGSQLVPQQNGSLRHLQFCKSPSLTWMFSFPVWQTHPLMQVVGHLHWCKKPLPHVFRTGPESIN